MLRPDDRKVAASRVGPVKVLSAIAVTPIRYQRLAITVSTATFAFIAVRTHLRRIARRCDARSACSPERRDEQIQPQRKARKKRNPDFGSQQKWSSAPMAAKGALDDLTGREISSVGSGRRSAALARPGRQTCMRAMITHGPASLNGTRLRSRSSFARGGFACRCADAPASLHGTVRPSHLRHHNALQLSDKQARLR